MTTNQPKCRRCDKKIDLEHGAYFRREVWNDPEDTTLGVYLAYTCVNCIISKHGDFW